MFNDIVSIVLFNTVLQLQSKSFTAETPFVIMAQFISLAIVSIGIGLFFGMATALMFKYLRFLTVSAVTETFLMIASGMIAYFVAQKTVILELEMSGIISLLTCSIIQAHYTWYNLSPQGKSTTSVTFSFLGMTAEAAVYSYVGISLFSTIPLYWSLSWITAQCVIIIVGRIIAVICTFYLFRLCFKKKTINFRELLFISYGGMIRGAIAFALVMVIPYDDNTPGSDCYQNVECYSKENYYLARSTTLVVVIITTVFFGTFMKVT